jgi:hypothetical protein
MTASKIKAILGPVEKDLPMPAAHLQTNTYYPFDQMEPGDSFSAQTDLLSIAQLQGRVASAARGRILLHPEEEYATRVVGEHEVRCWRTS